MIEESKRSWYYLGCRNVSGHHLFTKEGNPAHIKELEVLDGQLCLEKTSLYIAVLTRIPELNYSALAWWDQTVDTRPGSNSIIFAPSLTCSIGSFHTAMERWFPWVLKRLPVQLVAVIPEKIYHVRSET